MVKPLLLVALLANIFLFVSSTGTAQAHAQSSASSSSSSSHAAAQSSASASAGGNQYGKRQHTCKKAVPCSSSASASASAISANGPPCEDPVCNENEIWCDCPIAVCAPKTCKEIDMPVACPDLRIDECCPVDPGCICQEGFVRNDAGICIPMKYCRKAQAQAQAQSSASSSSSSSYAAAQSSASASAGGNQYGKRQHTCKKAVPCSSSASASASAISANGPPCEDPVCNANEIWCDCPIAVCEPKTCKEIDMPVACPDLRIDECCPVNPGCICQQGYVRDDAGICIPMKYCRKAQAQAQAQSSASSSSSSSHAAAQSSASASAGGNQYGKRQHTCKKAVPCSSSASASASAISANGPPCEDPVCNANEIWSDCPIAVCVPKTCKDVGFAVACPDLRQDECCPVNPGCICQEGFVRDHAGICIPMKYCPSCGGDPYAESGCGTHYNRICSNYNEKPRPCPKKCLYNGCDCKAGFVFDEIKRKCTIPSECTYMTCKRKHEIYDPCPAPCPFHTCGINDAAILCAPPLCPGDPDCPPPKCRCKDGYYRNDVGDCVLWEQCPTCPNPNEVYDPCIAPCPPRTCDVDDRLIKCAAPPQIGDPSCQAGCRCADGYYKNSYGVCVTRAECTSCNGPHEYYDCGSPCDNVCETLHKQNKTHCPIVNIKCTDMCYCEDGYARDRNNICIPIEECYKPICRGKHEIYSDCIQGDCRPKDCSQLGFPVPCPRIDPKYCKKGCLCKEGYVRNHKGVCIPVKECPSCGGDPNAESGCGKNCGRLCSNYNKQGVKCTFECPMNGCNCKQGYAFDLNLNKCVLPKDCTPVCKENEVYSECINSPCPVQNCSQIDVIVQCVKIPPKDCIKGCICKPPYMREDNGVCVHISDCKPPVCKKNEVYSDCINGGCQAKNCSQIGLPIPCVKLDPKSCIKGCLCKDGYLREDNGECVPKEECKHYCNKPNEYYEPCDYDCPPRTCASLDRVYVCPIREDDICKAQCKCKEGFFRNTIGECITEKQCRKCMGPHEYFSCGGACDNVCSTLHKQNQTNCPIINIKCNEMCYCEKNYARAKNGTCIHIKHCKEDRCGKHERYEKCPAWLCEPQTCYELKYPKSCPDVSDDCKCPVEPACVCVDGYVRNDDGICIPKKDCHKICDGKHEVYDSCTNPTCRPKKCSQLGFPLNCTDPPKCKKGCVCKEGYVRNSKGHCIHIKDCPSCGGDCNAESGCGVNCGKKCEDIGKEPGACIESCQENGCDCKDGYYYDKKQKKCVLPCDCTPICSGKHEVYDNCTNPTCRPKKCSQLGFPLNCTHPPKCKKGCVCKEGYVRNSKGHCIHIKDCPSCGGDCNAESGCGVNCGKKCEDIGKEPGACILSCQENGCDCKDGYYYDKKQKKCVLPCDCTPICSGKHEVFDNCTNPTCRPKKCSQLGFPLNCTDPPKCKKGCVCKEGYVRNSKGHCIHIKDCPSCGGDCNAESGCGVNCGKMCEDIGKEPGACILICHENGCDCKDGYYYDKKQKKCVLPCDCTPICSGKHEVFDNCTNPTCRPKKCSQLGFPLNCTHPPKCKKGCVCKEGYVRNSKGHCIHIKDCPSCGGDCNAESGCGVNCGKKCEDIGKEPGACILSCQENGCDCKDGYYYDKKQKKCVLPCDCTPICSGKHEVYDNCTNPTCRPKKCSQLGFPLNCTDPPKCKKGCVCKEGYVRNSKGHCIHIKDCPSCGGDCNAESGCGVNCGKKCEDIGKEPGACILICHENGCDCKDGYYYDKKQKKCVLPCDCTETCSGKHEVFDNCTNPICRPKKCSQLGFPLNCTDPPKCKKGCVCKEGYVRNAKGHCINIKHCPSCGGDENAESGCGVNCLKKCYDLQNPDHPRPCPKICKVNSCDCKKEFYYDENSKKCVPSEKCSPTCGKNEVYDPCINGGCAMRNCSQIGGPKICIDPIKCKPGCACKDGYLRSHKGICIPIEKCPKAKCRENEKFVKCPNPCKPSRCDQLGYPIHCPATADDNCPVNPGCVCIEDYVKDSTGKCIPKRECPSCGGDRNAWSGCGMNCGKNCKDLEGIVRKCPKHCKENSCECKDDFYFDDNVKKCVAADCCSPTCGKDEVYDPCVNGGCGHRNCSQINGPIICIDPIKCIGGCTCKHGYLRVDDTGVCVPENKCPKICDKPNEEYVECPPNCPEDCASINKTHHCPKSKIKKTDCVGECRCKDGFYRNLIGECICKKDCLKCTGPHEYFSCGPACDNVCCDLATQSKDNCPIVNKKCTSMCYCEDGYARDDNGICVCISDCPGRGTTPEPTVNSTVALANFERGNTKLAIEFLRQLLHKRPGENFMFSALSVLIVLGQLTLSAIGISLEQLLRVLNLKNKNEIRTIFPILMGSINDQHDIVLKLANKIYGNKDLTFTEQFKRDSEYFDSEVENIDFTKNKEAANIINAWVSNKTNGQIKELVKADMFSSLTRVAFFNCMYFLGNWLHQFNPNKTQPRDFYLNDNDTVSLPTMFQENTYKYGKSEELDAQMLILPYKGEKYELLIILPNKKTGLESLLKKLDMDIIAKMKQSLTKERVKCYIPRMNLYTDISDLKDLLIKSNLTSPFLSNSNGFKGIFVKNNESLSITDAIQKSVFKINEKGTEAAVATGAIVGTTAVLVPPRSYTFDWNRPGAFFMFSDKNLLLCGVFVGAQ